MSYDGHNLFALSLGSTVGRRLFNTSTNPELEDVLKAILQQRRREERAARSDDRISPKILAPLLNSMPLMLWEAI